MFSRKYVSQRAFPTEQAPIIQKMNKNVRDTYRYTLTTRKYKNTQNEEW